MKKKNSSYILIIIFIIGLSVLLYPTVSNYINQKNQSEAIATYDKKVSKMTKKDFKKYFEEAEAYNEKLAQHPDAFFNPDEIEGYEKILDISGTGIMGYVTIDKIDQSLPIYHGTDQTVLEIASGHFKGTSFPIGGKSTHIVISAHRGLPSAKLFTDLDKMEVGDTFTITVLNRILTYEVDKISIVEPAETEGLQIEEGKDYCTLMTCTPYGINSERLLVRGHRIPTNSKRNVKITSEAFRIEPLLVATALAVPMFIILLLLLLCQTKMKRGKKL